VSLKKPPIVEMWVEFNFDRNPGEEVGRAYAFLQSYSSEYPQLEVTGEDQLEFRQVSPAKIPEIVSRKQSIKHLRVHSGQGNRWLQLTPTQLVCNSLRLGESYPGFDAMSTDAVAKLVRYSEMCGPVKLRFAAIHYVDVIEVPVASSGEVQLEDYFTLGLDVPKDPFGSQLSYLMKTMIRPADGTGHFEVQLQFEQAVSERNVFRFRMDWHKFCPYDGEVDPLRVLQELKRADESVFRCFRAAFTEKAWQLFEPSD
jgi:uncharacterized protein (TIGR04255 family)